jgi:hypothetical protein
LAQDDEGSRFGRAHSPIISDVVGNRLAVVRSMIEIEMQRPGTSRAKKKNDK